MKKSAEKYAQRFNERFLRKDFNIHVLPEGEEAMTRHLDKLKSILGEDDRRVKRCEKAFILARSAMAEGIRFLPAEREKSHPDLFTEENGDIRLPF